MVYQCLVVDVRASHVALAVASDAPRTREDCLLLRDCAGRFALPVDTPSLWNECESSEISLKDSIRFVTTLFGNGPNDQALDNSAAIEASALASLLCGLKQFAESRLESAIDELLMLMPNDSSGSRSDAFRSRMDAIGKRAGFKKARTMGRAAAAVKAYAIDELYMTDGHVGVIVVVDVDLNGTVSTAVLNVEDGIIDMLECSYGETDTANESDVEAALLGSLSTARERAGVAMEHVDGVVLMGDLTDFQAEDIAFTVQDNLPDAEVYKSISPMEVALRGAASTAQQRMQPPDPHAIFMCCLQPCLLTIGVETDGAVMTPLVVRNTLLPVSETSCVRVYWSSERNVNDDDDHGSVRLCFYKGERLFVGDNVLLCTLQVGGLRVGWNEIQVRVSVTEELVITIESELVVKEKEEKERFQHAIRDEIPIPSMINSMDSRDIAAFIESMLESRAPAVHQTRFELLKAQHCTEALLGTALELIGRSARPILSQSGRILSRDHHLAEAGCTSSALSSSSRLFTLLDTLDLTTELSFPHAAVHNSLLQCLGESIEWPPSAPSRCCHCRGYQRENPSSD